MKHEFYTRKSLPGVLIVRQKQALAEFQKSTFVEPSKEELEKVTLTQMVKILMEEYPNETKEGCLALINHRAFNTHRIRIRAAVRNTKIAR